MAAGRRDGRDLVLEVRVQPRASRSEISGTLGERLRVRLQAPPVDGRANAALIEFLAETFDVPRAAVTIERGVTGRDKRVRVHGAGPLPPQVSALIGCD